MTRAVVAVLLVALLIIGVGVAVSARLEVGATSSRAATSTPATVVSPPTSSTATPAPPATAPSMEGELPSSTATVTMRKGSVESRRGAGPWQALNDGAILSENDVVRTGRRAEVKLRFGEQIEVRLSPRSELTIRDLSEAVSRIRLDQGHVTAVVGSTGQVLRVQVRNTDAEVRSERGAFGLATDGNGQLAVAATTGRVSVETPKAAVEVAEGQFTTVVANEVPAPPTALPASLFLKVGALAATQTNQAATTVRGKTSPGAVVRIGDHVAPADASGSFEVKVPLQEGRNELHVEVVDAAGRRRDQALPPIIVDRSKPPLDAAIQWGRRE
jgi:hypothetical protein